MGDNTGVIFLVSSNEDIVYIHNTYFGFWKVDLLDLGVLRYSRITSAPQCISESPMPIHSRTSDRLLHV